MADGSSMSNLPLGWGDRKNQMSERDMKLGGIAATKFAAKNAYDGTTNATYKSDDQVRKFYLDSYQTSTGRDLAPAAGSSGTPDFWADRQKERNLQAQQMGVFASKANASGPSHQATRSPAGAYSSEVALVRIATQTLETMATALEQKPDATIPMEERTAIAAAMKKAMEVLAQQSS